MWDFRSNEDIPSNQTLLGQLLQIGCALLTAHYNRKQRWMVAALQLPVGRGTEYLSLVWRLQNMFLGAQLTFLEYDPQFYHSTTALQCRAPELVFRLYRPDVQRKKAS